MVLFNKSTKLLILNCLPIPSTSGWQLTACGRIKSNQISLFLTQLQLQQNELKLNTQNAQSREKKFKVSHQINPVAEAYREAAKGP